MGNMECGGSRLKAEESKTPWLILFNFSAGNFYLSFKYDDPSGT